ESPERGYGRTTRSPVVASRRQESEAVGGGYSSPQNASRVRRFDFSSARKRVFANRVLNRRKTPCGSPQPSHLRRGWTPTAHALHPSQGPTVEHCRPNLPWPKGFHRG